MVGCRILYSQELLELDCAAAYKVSDSPFRCINLSMRASDPCASNLFERLSHYSPSEGDKRQKEPLEDFMTEALAYFLRTSEKFREGFVRAVLKRRNLKVEPEGIATQQTEHGHDGRAELILRAADEHNIGIEVKRSRHTEFQDRQPRKGSQLQRMKDGFGENAYLLAPRCVLYLKEAELKTTGVTRASWEDVHGLADRLSKDPRDPQRDLFKQFADFLKLRGLSKIPIRHHPMKIKSMTEAARLLDDWAEVLRKLKAHLKFPDNARIVWDTPDEKHRASFLGIYGKGDSPYAGFRIDEDGRVQCHYEQKDPGGKWDGRTEPYPENLEREMDEELLHIFQKLQDRVRGTWAKKKRGQRQRSCGKQSKS